MPQLFTKSLAKVGRLYRPYATKKRTFSTRTYEAVAPKLTVCGRTVSLHGSVGPLPGTFIRSYVAEWTRRRSRLGSPAKN